MAEHSNAWRRVLTCLAIVVAAGVFESDGPGLGRPYISYETRRIGTTEMKWPVYHLAPRIDRWAPFGVYVPVDVDDAIAELNKTLPKPLIEEMRAGSGWDMLRYHHGIGQWIRNNWGLWGGSRLQRYFFSIGVFHPDEMSGTILDCYWVWLQSHPSKSGGR
jgi:hypothetical protein